MILREFFAACYTSALAIAFILSWSLTTIVIQAAGHLCSTNFVMFFVSVKHESVRALERQERQFEAEEWQIQWLPGDEARQADLGNLGSSGVGSRELKLECCPEFSAEARTLSTEASTTVVRDAKRCFLHVVIPYPASI